MNDDEGDKRRSELTRAAEATSEGRDGDGVGNNQAKPGAQGTGTSPAPHSPERYESKFGSFGSRPQTAASGRLRGSRSVSTPCAGLSLSPRGPESPVETARTAAPVPPA